MASPAQHGSSTGCAGVVGPVLVSGPCQPCSSVSKTALGKKDWGLG